MPHEFSLEARQTRLAKNQSLFRAVNEQVEQLASKHTVGDPLDVLCECANLDCAGRIEITRAVYEAVRQDDTRFFVLPGHIFSEVERIVEETGRYVVVEKTGAAGEVAAAEGKR